MRKLLNTLYVNNPEGFLMLENDNVLVKIGEQVVLKLPLIALESIVSCGYKGASHRLMVACAEKGINLSFVSEGGKLLGTFAGESRGNVLLRKEQYRISDNTQKSLKFAQNFIFGKLYNSRWVLERAIRDYPDRLNIPALKQCSLTLKDMSKQALECLAMDSLRLLEGTAAQLYFPQFNELILQNKQTFFFKNRNRRPPLDPLNALLSLTYSMLAYDCRGACETVGLDAYCGFMHTDRAGRASLALDIMEELRPIIADRFVISLINLRKIDEVDFITSPNGAVLLSEKGRKKFFTAWQERKREIIIHPYLNEKVEWGLVPYCQALLLARTIRNDIDEYPPFLWK